MVVYKDNHFKTRSDRPNDDFVGNADYVIPDGSELAQKIMELYPNFKFVIDGDGNLVDVVAAEPQPEPEKPPEPPTNAELAAAIAELAEVICGG